MTKIASNYGPLIDALRGLDIPVEDTKRVVIDIQSGAAPIVYVELFGDEKVINVITALSSVEIERG